MQYVALILPLWLTLFCPTALSNPLTEKLEMAKKKADGLKSDYLPLLQSLKFKVVDGENGKKGVEINGIPPRSAFDATGLQNGDVLMAINGQDSSTQAHGLLLLEQLRTAKNFNVKVLRQGQVKNLEIKP